MKIKLENMSTGHLLWYPYPITAVFKARSGCSGEIGALSLFGYPRHSSCKYCTPIPQEEFLPLAQLVIPWCKLLLLLLMFHLAPLGRNSLPALYNNLLDCGSLICVCSMPEPFLYTKPACLPQPPLWMSFPPAPGHTSGFPLLHSILPLFLLHWVDLKLHP